MRSEFEKLPEISWRLRQDENLFNEKLNQYLFNCEGSEDFVNGAWYAFQEQQKKIDAANTLKNDLNGLIDGFLCCDFMAIKTDCVEFINGLKELLK